jgi:hypothetical protein
MKITKNIAKLLILVENLPISQRFAAVLSSKMGLDYNYIRRTLVRLEARNYLKSEAVRNKRYYSIGTLAPMTKIKRDYAQTEVELLNETQKQLRN